MLSYNQQHGFFVSLYQILGTELYCCNMLLNGGGGHVHGGDVHGLPALPPPL